MQYETKTHKIHTQTQINLCTVKWAKCDKTQSREPEELLIEVCLWLCTTSVQNTTQNSSDNLPSYHQTNIIAQ